MPPALRVAEGACDTLLEAAKGLSQEVQGPEAKALLLDGTRCESEGWGQRERGREGRGRRTVYRYQMYPFGRLIDKLSALCSVGCHYREGAVARKFRCHGNFSRDIFPPVEIGMKWVKNGFCTLP